MKKVSEKTKAAEHRGEGVLGDYKPWIKTREIMRGTGTRCNVIDPITGKTVHLLSINEMYAYFLLRWDDSVIDIREQFPLDIDATNEIADRLGFARVAKGKIRLTTDLLVTYTCDGEDRFTAYSIKNDPESLDKRDKEKLIIEKQYWIEKGVPFFMVYGDELDAIKANNLRVLYPYYNENSLRPGNEDDLIRHLIITKKIKVDLSVPLDSKIRQLPEVKGWLKQM